ncbi:MAG: ATP-binding protein [Syntrophorhabdales bacterium]|jgi:signal transduction histidine kinase
MVGEKFFKPSIGLKSIKRIFRNLSLRTQLLLILLFVLAISVISLSIISFRSEEMIVEKVTHDIDDITKAIQISVEELTYRGDSTQRLNNYVNLLNRKGIREISIISDDAQVIASSNPKKVGTTENPKKIGGQDRLEKKDLIITAKLGEESGKGGQRLYNVIMPVAIKGKNLGYIHISMYLDDYKYLQRRNHLKRILSTLFAFGIGIIVSLILASRYTDPIKKIAEASKAVAEGKLVRIKEKDRGDEIGVLVRSFNEMVEKLGERKELEEKLKKTEQLSMIGQLASGIAHEIRNPLNFLSLSVGHIRERLAEEGLSARDDIGSLLDNVKKELYRVNELINNFLFMGKPVTLNKGWVTAEALMQDAIYMIGDKVRDGIEIITRCPQKKMRLYCDREYMRMCLINLILNSAQAIEEKGTIVVSCAVENGMASISVEDNGKGVEAEDIDRIFEPYYSTKKLGIGIGLTITKRLVEEHGGTISAESISGKKTTVTIRVPDHEIS